MTTTEPTPIEQLLALELAREERRRRRNRLLVVASVVLAVALVVYLGFVRVADRRADEEREGRAMYCDLIHGFGTDDYESCVVTG